MIPLGNSSLVPVIVDAALRGALILLVAMGAAWLMRRSSAASRHLVWLAALLAVLILPLARGVVPEWRVLPLPEAARGAFVAAPPARPAELPAAAPVPEPAAQAPARAPFDWPQALLLVWVVGAGLVALRLVYGLIRVHWLAARAVELTDEGWTRLTDGLSRRLGLGRIVRLLRGPGATVPMTWGIFSPVILLPGEADGWDEERRRVVLAHELAHVGRWDALTQWIAHLAVALYWFNPLVWMAARRLREEREHACDDAVLISGARPVEYADHLLTIVRSLRSGEDAVAALAMARRSQFEGRMLAILDSAVRRNGVTRAAALGSLAAALACVLPLAAVQAVEPAPAAQVRRAAGTLPVGGARVGEATRQVAASGPEAAPARTPARVAAAPVHIDLAGADERQLTQVMADADPDLYAEIIRAAAEIRSDAGRRMVLMELLHRPELSRDNVAAIVAATRGMQSDTERRIVLSDAVRHRAFTAAALSPLMGSVRAFTSSTEQRIVLELLLERESLSQDELVGALQIAAHIATDTDLRIVLQKAAYHHRLGEAAREAFVAATRTMADGSERGIALQSLLAQTGRDEQAARSPAQQAGEAVWDADLSWDDEGREVLIDAKKVVYSVRRWEIVRIGRGGQLIVEEKRPDGDTCRLEVRPGPDGRPVFTYRRNGVVMPFEQAEQGWMAAIIREFTGS